MDNMHETFNLNYSLIKSITHDALHSILSTHFKGRLGWKTSR